MSDEKELIATARLFAVLLQRELDAALARRLAEHSDLAGAMAAVGLEVPDPDDADALDRLAAHYLELFVLPTDGPPFVQSVAAGGSYEGDAAAAIRRIVEPLGLTRDRGGSRGAPVDHLGSELEIWAEIRERAPEHAEAFARHHLAWARPLLRHRSRAGSGFYPALCRATDDLLALIVPAPVEGGTKKR